MKDKLKNLWNFCPDLNNQNMPLQINEMYIFTKSHVHTNMITQKNKITLTWIKRQSSSHP